MKLDEIFAEWEKDAALDKSKLDEESLNKPLLHSKWLKIFSMEKTLFKAVNSDYDKLYNLRVDYYCGKLSQEELKAHGWEQNPLRILKEDLGRYLKADDILIQASLKVGLQEEKLSVLKQIIDSINGRGWDIRNAIEFLKWKNGIN